MHGANDAASVGAGEARAIRLCGLVALGLLAAFATAAHGADAPSPASDAPAFQAGDISIGDPIALPFDRPIAGPPQVSPPAAAIRRPEAAAAAAAPGNGWLGLVVAESATPGRFAVAEVAAGGPAATGGILAGDEVRAIDGLPLRNSDEVAQALTAIAPGQKVRLAIGRGEQLADVTLEAIPRPAASRGWGAVTAPAEPQVAVASPVAATAPVAPPSVSVPAPAPPAAMSTPAAVPTGPPVFSQPSQPTPGGSLAMAAQTAPAALPPPARFVQPAATSPTPDRRPTPARFAEPPAAAAAAPVAEATQAAADSRGRTALGVRTLPIDPNVQARFRLPEASGAYVIGVVGDLPASKAGVPPGSVIVALDNRPVRSPAELTQLVTNGPVGRPVSLEYVLPGGTARRAEVVLQTLERPLEEALVGGVEPAVTDVPTLQPQPAATTARRPLIPLDGPTAAVVRDEIRQLRLRLESLERRLESAGR